LYKPFDYEQTFDKESKKNNVKFTDSAYKFSQTEGAVKKHPFETFYTT